jgi:WD40 repeat protein
VASTPDGTRLQETTLEGFSEDVRSIARKLEPAPMTVWQLADALLQAHREDSGIAPPPSLAGRAGEPRLPAGWLEPVRRLFDPGALAQQSMPGIDWRLTLLGLARLDAGLDRALRETKARWRLEDSLGYPLADVFWPWALPPRPTEWLELSTIRDGGAIGSCTFSPDGRLLAITGRWGTVSLWDPASGKKRAMLFGHQSSVSAYAFSPDGRLLASGGEEGTVRLWDPASGDERAAIHDRHPVHTCVFSPDGQLLAIGGQEGTVRLWQMAEGGTRAVLSGHRGAVRLCAFSSDGRLLASAGDDGTVRLWDLTGDSERATLRGHQGPARACAFSPDGQLLATAGNDSTVRLWNPTTGSERTTLRGHEGSTWCAFSPDGRLLATAGEEGLVRLWDSDGNSERATLHGHEGGVVRCAFSPDGQLLASAGEDGTARLWDVAVGSERAVLRGHEGTVLRCLFSPDGQLLATTGADGTARLWEEVETPGELPVVAADVVDGADLIGIGADATAIANLIAARETAPPLSIGLFGDWGSGKSFLIGQVQERVRRLASRSRRAERSAYCGYVRNVSFNAWHYADANLWASLVTHIFDELAKPEPAAGVTDEETAQAQLARLEEELAVHSALAERMERAREHTRVVEARRRVLRWTWGLTGLTKDRSLGELGRDVRSMRGAFGLLVPNARVRLGLILAALLLGAGAAAIVALLGGATVARSVAGVIAAVAAPLALLRLAGRHVSKLLEQAGKGARAIDVRDASIDAEVEVARATELELRREVADLSSGRRIARLAAARSADGDYRAHLGLVSRIHDDFVRMSDILRVGAPRAEEEEDASGLPRIERIVLYIDDLDRCPPDRVIQVLEAVHLILAVPLFVVVLAVDPRWLLQSLQLHYSELLAQHVASSENDAKQDGAAWHSTPMHYLEKIIQVPFALRPMGESSVRSLVHGLLPIQDASGAAVEQGPSEPAQAMDETSSSSPQRPDSPEAPNTERRAPSQASTPSSTPSLSPRALALSEHERDFAVKVAAGLPTPRTVKKFTNLYRLLRAGLDEHSGQLDRFLAEDSGDAAESQAVMILLATIIAFPEEASEFLLGLGPLGSAAPPERGSWTEYVQDADRWSPALRGFLGTVTRTSSMGPWTREPFRSWALEVSRYSFATGQEVFARLGKPYEKRNPFATGQGAAELGGELAQT